MKTTPVLALLSAVASLGLLAFTNVAAADLPQHIPVQGFEPAETDFAAGLSPDAQFGHGVAIRNGMAFLGIPSAQALTGRVAVFTQTATGWQRTATLAAPTPGSDRHFGRTITFRDGVVVIGSDEAAYVFRQDTGKFNYVQKLTPPAADGAIEFPMALRYQDGMLFASAYRGAALPSVVYLFELDSTRKFVRRSKLTGPATNELFGADLSMTNTTLVVGSPGGRSRLRQFGLFHHGQGSAYVFQRDSNGLWRLTQRLAAARQSGGFGSAVAIDRGMIIVGAPQENIEGGPRGAPTLDNHIAGGAAYVFLPVAGRYVETLRLRPRPDERIQYMDFGHRIALFAGHIVIAAVQPYGNVDHIPGGFAFSYSREGSKVIARGIAAGHSVAHSIGLFHNQLLLGISGFAAESARIYDIGRVTRTTLPLTYRLTHVLTQVVDEPGERQVRMMGLNDKGEVLGRLVEPFVWRNGTFETLSMPERRLEPIAINDDSQIAAECVRFGFGAERVCLRFDNQFSPLDVPNEFVTRGLDLSNAGHVLGTTESLEFKLTHFVWHNGKFTTLEPLPGFAETAPARMNDRGTIVVGVARREGSTVPVIWQNGTVMPLSPPPGFSFAQAVDINDRGMALLTPPYIWQAGKFTRLNPLFGLQQNHIALSLNNQGVVAGYTGVFATLWLEGHGTDLRWLISSADPLRPFVHALQAHFINDRNQVLMQGQDSRDPGDGYYLLSPVDLEE